MGMCIRFDGALNLHKYGILFQIFMSNLPNLVPFKSIKGQHMQNKRFTIFSEIQNLKFKTLLLIIKNNILFIK